MIKHNEPRNPLISISEFLTDICFDTVGCAILAIGVYSFTAANQIVPSGIMGIATLINFMYGGPIGVMSLLLNIPLFIFGFIYLGGPLIFKTIKTMVIFSVLIDYVFVAFEVPKYQGEQMLAALFGGVLIGAGLAIVFIRGSTTGGTDIAGKLIRLKFPHIQLGRAILMLDCAVLILAVFAYRNLEAGLYGLIAMFTAAKVIDALLYGLDVGRMVLVVSKRSDIIAKEIITNMGRGVTLLPAKGAYSDEDKTVMLCAVRKTQFFQLKKIVRSYDPTAFMIVTEAGEILGQGFTEINKDT